MIADHRDKPSTINNNKNAAVCGKPREFTNRECWNEDGYETRKFKDRNGRFTCLREQWHFFQIRLHVFYGLYRDVTLSYGWSKTQLYSWVGSTNLCPSTTTKCTRLWTDTPREHELLFRTHDSPTLSCVYSCYDNMMLYTHIIILSSYAHRYAIFKSCTFYRRREDSARML